ncbi:hypothetical protein Ddye_022590 [Dipteronia dyeriana]|uniref:Uncharacterized protein n=1 Tax=Dipteronia dyeriana TaxID=168575 RepID=A0AAD9TRU0_9ROSI|nr:hypothetical protein Ddye_022590 [Dipteronia dyeriana]
MNICGWPIISKLATDDWSRKTEAGEDGDVKKEAVGTISFGRLWRITPFLLKWLRKRGEPCWSDSFFKKVGKTIGEFCVLKIIPKLEEG